MSKSSVRMDSQLCSVRSIDGGEVVVVGMVFGPEWLRNCDRLPAVKNRTSIVMSLIKSYGLLTDGRVEIIRPRKAGYVDLASFHSSDYLDACFDPKLSSDPDDGSADENGRLSEFGLELDCHLVPGLPDLMGWVAGGSIAAANWLVTNYEGPEAANLGKCRVALNWGGGWHHAQKDQASGFCYVNDVVLAILELRSRFSKILYVDLDVHHGDAVEDAFAFSKKVFTLSIHLKEVGFFPGTGALDSVGFGNGKFHCLNVPIGQGVDDDQYIDIFSRIFVKVAEKFRPDAIVVQCGADCLSKDPLGGFNLTLRAPNRCLETILTHYNAAGTGSRTLAPAVLVLGGGGYDNVNAARLWTTLTHTALRCCHLSPRLNENVIVSQLDQEVSQAGKNICAVDLPEDIPDEDPFFLLYGPSYDLQVSKGNIRNTNTTQSISQVVKGALSNIEAMDNSEDG